MRVILAEKPDMGKNIAAALGIKKNNRGYIELNNGDIVTWAIGHILRLKTPDAYPEYKEWQLESLPIIPDPMLSEVDPAKKEQFEIIKRLLAATDTCIIATDPGREGEHIGRTILEACKFQGKIKRLWIDDLTPSTIQEGFKRLKDGSETHNLGEAAKVRAYADYWVGMTATRFFTLTATKITKEKTILSAGRVQTPTLRIVYDRELEIEKFVPTPFYQLEAEFKTHGGVYKGRWYKDTPQGKINRFEDKLEAEKIRKKVDGKDGKVIQYETKKVRRSAPQLLHSTSIKTVARKAYGFGIEETMKLLQSIYDKGFCTYPRTSSRHLSENAADQLENNLKKLKESSKYKELFPNEICSIREKSRFVDNKKATEHHAIVPTGMNPSGLTEKEEKLYELILRYTLAAFYPEGVDQETLITTEVDGETFSTRAVIVIEEGWRKVLKMEAENEPELNESPTVAKLPSLREGDRVNTEKIEMLTGKTSPPKRLADSDLEKAMENAGHIIESEDEEIMQHLKEKGIGTPATRTHIIGELVNRGYIEIKKNLVYLTDKGRNFMELVYHHPLASIELTGEFEKKLNQVAEGKLSSEALLNEFKQFAHDILNMKVDLERNIESKQQGKPLFEKGLDVIGSCPKCGQDVVEREKFYGCVGYKDGCDFKVWKEFMKVKLSSKMICSLIEGKEVLLQKIPGQFGSYSLLISLKDGKIETRKPQADELSLGSCPECGKEVLERERFYGCSGFRDGCKFTIPKEFLGKKLSTAQIRKLLTKGRTDVIKGFSGSKGQFDSALAYSKETKRLVFIK